MVSKAFAKSKYTTSTPVFSCRNNAIEFVKVVDFLCLIYILRNHVGAVRNSIRFSSSSCNMRSKTFTTKLISEVGR